MVNITFKIGRPDYKYTKIPTFINDHLLWIFGIVLTRDIDIGFLSVHPSRCDIVSKRIHAESKSSKFLLLRFSSFESNLRSVTPKLTS